MLNLRRGLTSPGLAPPRVAHAGERFSCAPGRQTAPPRFAPPKRPGSRHLGSAVVLRVETSRETPSTSATLEVALGPTLTAPGIAGWRPCRHPDRQRLLSGSLRRRLFGGLCRLLLPRLDDASGSVCLPARSRLPGSEGHLERLPHQHVPLSERIVLISRPAFPSGFPTRFCRPVCSRKSQMSSKL